MNTELFLAQKIRKTKGKTFSSSVIAIGTASIAIGVAAILLSFSVLLGFKDTIKEKLFLMSGHMQMSKITLNQSFEELPFEDSPELQGFLQEEKNVSRVQAVAFKSALLKSETQISGTVLKGVGEDYDWKKFETNLVEGRPIGKDSSSYAKEIVLSLTQKRLLSVEIGDELLIYFIQNPPRARKVKVVGFYTSGIEEMDKAYSFVDIDLIRRINGWASDEIGHSEIFLNDFDKMDQTINELYAQIPPDLQLTKITNMLHVFFEWFNLLDRNIVIVIVLVIIVASFNMVSVLLIMIMERTPMIGLLKAVGTKNSIIQRIFVLNALQIVVKGLLIGNGLALVLCFLQYQFKLIPLDPVNYYMSYVPVSWSLPVFLLVNLGTVLVVGLIVYLPTWAILRISPVKALKYKD
ncbi:ABC transporter permease [Marinilongibacter aquaticus]|uniref:ABC transporter permease n=1 Tax=Marinilongibacter aquaticus TaxID=2975157 RepID=UPI0021BDDC3F|nr:FtsX-like permease family protein [Marinilongibacter aquaticus]UBM59439.1 ABC transporter permease [Marinilongibacter aquaticus]